MVKALLFCMPDIYQSWHELHIKGPWLGGVSLAANAPNHKVYVADLVLKRKDVKSGVDEAIKKTSPELIGLSAMTFQYPTAVRIAKYIKKNYKVPVALGGYHATSMREEIAKEADVFDYIFAGESEQTFNDFLNLLETNKLNRLNKITGLSYKKNGKWIHNKRHSAISISKGLASINLPKRDCRIWKGYHFHSRKVDTAEFSRGCDNKCKFCSMRAMMPEARFSAYPIERIILDLKEIKKRGVKSVFFCDDNPAMNPVLFKELLSRTIKEKLNDLYYSGMVSTLSMSDIETTKLMKKAGWDFVFLGVENIYQGTLKNMHKASTVKLAEKAISNLHKSGITILAGIIIGNPDDTEETIRRNFRWFYNQPIDSLMPQFLTPYPGTETRKELLEEGLTVNKGGLDNEYGGWSTYNGEFAHCKTRTGLMPQEIERIAYEEFQKFNKRRIIQTFLGKLNFPKNNPKHFFNYLIKEFPPASLRILRTIGMNSSEKARLERQRKIEMNQFNI